MSLLPGSEVDEGDGDGVTGHQWVAVNHIGQFSGTAACFGNGSKMGLVG